MNRFNRQVGLFGADGQKKISEHNVAIIGAGGLGSLAIQQAAYLGVGAITIIEFDDADETNLNRTVSLFHDDVYESDGSIISELPSKVEVAERLIKRISPCTTVIKVNGKLTDKASIEKIHDSDSLIGCLDNEGARLVLTEIGKGLLIPYFDFSSEIVVDNKAIHPGGRVFYSGAQKGCLVCSGELDISEASVETLGDNVVNLRNRIYGIEKDSLQGSGPSVISLNGVIASLGMTKWMFWVTGIREPKAMLTYRADRGIVTVNQFEELSDYCHFCDSVVGKPHLSHYLKGIV